MDVVMISGATLREFVDSEGGGFEAAVDALFQEVDEDGDGRLSMTDLWRALRNLGLILPGEHDPSTDQSYCKDHAINHAMQCMHDIQSSLSTLMCSSSSSSSVETLCYMDSHHFHPLIRDIVLAIAHDLRGCPLHLLLPNHTTHNNSADILAQAIKYEQSRPYAQPMSN